MHESNLDRPGRPAVLRLLLGPLVLVAGSLSLLLVTIVAFPTSNAAFDWPIGLAVWGGLIGGALIGWRAGARWARWVAWALGVLLLVAGGFGTSTAIWAAEFYRSPDADLPLLIGVPIVALVGAIVTLATLVWPQRARSHAAK